MNRHTHSHNDMLWREDATERVAALREEFLESHPTETIDIDDLATRVVAERVTASADMPPADHATMDGFAFDATHDYPFRVVDGEVFPEDEPPTLGAGEAVRIATGAPLPREANAVLKREDARVEGGSLTGEAIEPGTYTYEAGSNVRAGDTLYAPGDRVGPKDAILLRDVGRERVEAYARFSVGVLATGTEIHEGQTMDLDSPMLSGLARAWGHEAAYEGTVPDDYDRVESRIGELAAAHDVVVTTGGTSVGKKDHVIAALESLGDVRFHRVRIRPGKPIAAASLPDHDAVAFAIPGKPIGALTSALLVARPFFGPRPDLPSVTRTCARGFETGPAGFEYVVPVADRGDEVVPLGHADSALSVYESVFDPSVLSSSSRAASADGFLVTRDGVERGETVRVVPYPALE